jgi:hypothetical protein
LVEGQLTANAATKSAMNSRSAIWLACAALLAAAMILPGQSGASPQTLTEHLLQQLTRRTNGSFYFTKTLAGGPCFVTPPALTTNFWLRDVTNILASSVGMIRGGCLNSDASFVTPISPRHVISAAHTGGQGLDGSVWLLPDGTLYTNTAVRSANGQPAREIIPGTDIIITLMQKTNPAFCKYLPDITSKVPAWRDGNFATHPAPPFVRFHLNGRTGLTNHTSFISAGRGMGSFGGIQASNCTLFGDYAKGDAWVGGDSASPAYAIINNEAVLICVAYTGGGGPAIARFTNQINAVMANLSTNHAAPVYTVTSYDVSIFPDE